MAGTFLRVDVDATQALAGLDQLVAKIRNLRPFFKEVGEELVTSTKNRFDQGVSPEGEKWAALSKTYQARKRKNKDKVLILDGYLRNMIRPQASATEVLVGTNRNYGAVHQFGASQGAFGQTKRGAPIPWGNIPARPYLGLSAQDETAIQKLLQAYLLE